MTGDQINLECGTKFIRLAAPPPKEGPAVAQGQIVWTSEGRSAVVACKAVTRVDIK
jgi:hypothetical protein